MRGATPSARICSAPEDAERPAVGQEARPDHEAPSARAIRLEMPPSVYNFDRLPVLVKPATVAVIVASSMIVSALSALFPAAQAARLNPVEALRHD